MKKAKVVVLKTNPATVLDDIEKGMMQAGCATSLRTGTEVLLKNNISWHYPFPGANTTPWQLEGVIRSLGKMGYEQITSVENRTVVTDPFKGERLNKYRAIYDHYGVPVKYNFRSEDMKWIPYLPKGKLNILDRIYPNGIHIPDYFLGKNVLHLPTTKCHIYTTTTGSMKNAFGGLLNTNRHYCHSHIHEVLVDLLLIQKEIHPGIFTVMDGTTAGNGPGPRTMIPVRQDYLLFSDDSVAIDAVAAKMMGFNPLEVGYIRLATEQGLGMGALEEIEIIGEDIRDVNYRFVVGNNLVSKFGGVAWFGALKRLQRFLFHTPLVAVFIFASYLYHDFFWYQTKGKKIVNQWLKTSPWGQLFTEY